MWSLKTRRGRWPKYFSNDGNNSVCNWCSKSQVNPSPLVLERLSVCKMGTQTIWLIEYGRRTEWSDDSSEDEPSEHDGVGDVVDTGVAVGEDLVVKSDVLDEVPAMPEAEPFA